VQERPLLTACDTQQRTPHPTPHPATPRQGLRGGDHELDLESQPDHPEMEYGEGRPGERMYAGSSLNWTLWVAEGEKTSLFVLLDPRPEL
jgi:hypothetical protein